MSGVKDYFQAYIDKYDFEHEVIAGAVDEQANVTFSFWQDKVRRADRCGGSCRSTAWASSQLRQRILLLAVHPIEDCVCASVCRLVSGQGKRHASRFPEHSARLWWGSATSNPRVTDFRRTPSPTLALSTPVRWGGA